jgi:hypothetical protein
VTTRLLPPEEWHRLAGTEAEGIVPALDPVDARVLVVEDQGAIVGTWVLMRIVHAECVWIAPSHRGKASVAGRLLAGMRSLARIWGSQTVWTCALTDDVAGMVTKLGGVTLPGRHFALPVGVK